MTPSFPDIEAIIQESASGCVVRDAFYDYCDSHKLEFADLCNTIAMTVARRFNESTMTFDDADGVMNALSGLMVGHAHLKKNAEARFPEPAWSIYEAFDAGEDNRKDVSDPIEQFTKPLVRQILGHE